MLYQRKSRMTIRQQQKLLEHVVAGTTARAAAMLVGVQANTAIRFYQRLRRLIASKVERYELSGEVEADESYFGGVRKGRRGRGAAGKVPVFGLLKRGGKVYTAMIPNAQRRRGSQLSERRFCRTASSIQTVSKCMMCWMCRSFTPTCQPQQRVCQYTGPSH